MARVALDVPVVLVSLVDEDRQFFKTCLGLPEPWSSRRETPLSHSFCQYAVATGRELVVEDAREEPLLASNLAVPDLDVIAYAGVPIRSAEGPILGTFCVIDSTPRRWADTGAGWPLTIRWDAAAGAATTRAKRRGRRRRNGSSA